MIKKILPFESLVYRSTLNQEELVAHLQQEIEAEKAVSFGIRKNTYSKPYIGKITQNTFEIKRTITYQNSFLPIIKGEIQNSNNGSKVIVKMELLVFVKIFMIIWLALVSVGCIATAYYLIFHDGLQSEVGIFTLIPFMMLLFGAAMFFFGFKLESRKSIKDLEQILKAKLIES